MFLVFGFVSFLVFCICCPSISDLFGKTKDDELPLSDLAQVCSLLSELLLLEYL